MILRFHGQSDEEIIERARMVIYARCREILDGEEPPEEIYSHEAVDPRTDLVRYIQLNDELVYMSGRGKLHVFGRGLFLN